MFTERREIDIMENSSLVCFVFLVIYIKILVFVLCWDRSLIGRMFILHVKGCWFKSNRFQ